VGAAHEIREPGYGKGAAQLRPRWRMDVSLKRVPAVDRHPIHAELGEPAEGAGSRVAASLLVPPVDAAAEAGRESVLSTPRSVLGGCDPAQGPSRRRPLRPGPANAQLTQRRRGPRGGECSQRARGLEANSRVGVPKRLHECRGRVVPLPPGGGAEEPGAEERVVSAPVTQELAGREDEGRLVAVGGFARNARPVLQHDLRPAAPTLSGLGRPGVEAAQLLGEGDRVGSAGRRDRLRGRARPRERGQDQGDESGTRAGPVDHPGKHPSQPAPAHAGVLHPLRVASLQTGIWLRVPMLVLQASSAERGSRARFPGPGRRGIICPQANVPRP
jgi:hypothetical protein